MAVILQNHLCISEVPVSDQLPVCRQTTWPKLGQTMRVPPLQQ